MSADRSADGEVILRAESLHRFYRVADQETLALRGVSLSAAAGETVAVVGPSGAGKSTLLSCLAGLEEPDGGTVSVAGELITHRPEPERARLRARGIGVLLQSSNLIEHLSVVQNVALAARLTRRPSPPEIATRLDRLGIAERADALPRQLSGGETVRAALAVALANDPWVLLADEPTGELDSRTETSVLELLGEVAGRGVAVVVAGHSEALAAASDRRLTLVDGQVAA